MLTELASVMFFFQQSRRMHLGLCCAIAAETPLFWSMMCVRQPKRKQFGKASSTEYSYRNRVVSPVHLFSLGDHHGPKSSAASRVTDIPCHRQIPNQSTINSPEWSLTSVTLSTASALVGFCLAHGHRITHAQDSSLSTNRFPGKSQIALVALL